MTTAPGRSHDHGLAYAEEHLGEVDPALFSRRTAPGGTGVVVSGTCPRCHGRTESPFPWAMPGTGTKGVLGRLLGTATADPAPAEPDPLFEETHFCECGHAHPQCPPDTWYRGCGASWRVRR
ncbi:hypothetical protein AB0B78_07425 [Streptomyces sp. NPDC040724]|uniref:hypothetical protein n=1 Tax=unclassified Streptomyces TaxID=2593676 RepID=UPI0033F1C33E